MSKPPVVLIHGMWSMPDTLTELRMAFESQGYQVHSPRLPYHYPREELSDNAIKHFGSASIQEYVDSIYRFVKGLNEAPILVGHSMGGLIAQLVAAKIHCNRLILLSSAAPAGINTWSWSVIRTFGHNLFKFPLWKTVTNLTIKNVSYGIANSQSPALHREIMKDITYESGLASTQIGMWFMFKNPPTRVEYSNIHCPVLIIGGTEDKITPLTIQTKIAAKYSTQATLKIVQGCCHWTVGGSYFPEISENIFDWLGTYKQAKAA